MIQPAGLRIPDHWRRGRGEATHTFLLACISARRRMTGETRKMLTEHHPVVTAVGASAR